MRKKLYVAYIALCVVALFRVCYEAVTVMASVAYTAITASAILDAGGNALQNGTITFSPVDANGNPMSSQGMIARGVTCVVLTGAITTQQNGATCQAADALAQNPTICYKITLMDTVRGTQIPTPGQNCAQPTGSTWSYDSYVPSGAAVQLQTVGLQGPIGPAPTISSATATAESYGASPSVILSGANPYSFLFMLPNGAPGAGSGTVGSSLAGAPVASHPMGTGGSTYNEVDAGAGPFNVPGLVTDGVTDNTSVLQTQINKGNPLILPDNCEAGGNIALSGPLSFGSGLNAPPIKGGGWHTQLCTTNLIFTATSYTNGAINLASGNAVGQDLSNMNINASGIVTSGAAIYSDAPGASNFQHFDTLQIGGFPQDLLLLNVGNLNVGQLYLIGLPASDGVAGLPLFEIAGSGNNSNKILGLGGVGGTNEFNAAAGTTLFSFGTPSVPTSGMGNEFHFHDAVGFPQVAYQNGGQASYWFANTEQRTGPIFTLASGSATVHWGNEQGQMQYLGPPFVAGTNSKMYLDALTPLVTAIAAPTLQSQSATLGSYAAGNYWYWIQAYGSLNAGAATVNLNSSVSLSKEVTFASGTANEVTLGFPVASSTTNPIVGATSYNVLRNTSNTLTGAVLIATGQTGPTYVSNGSESTTVATPPDANVPLALQGQNATVIGNCQNGPLSLGNPTANFNYARMAMDRYGRYFNPCLGPEIPLADWAFATPSQENAGACDMVLAAPGSTGQDARYCILTTTTAAGTTYQWVNTWADQGTQTYTGTVNVGAGFSSPSLIIMNCSSTCNVTLTSQPFSTWHTSVVSIGSTLATINLHSGITWYGGSTAPTLVTGKPIKVSADSTTATNFVGG